MMDGFWGRRHKISGPAESIIRKGMGKLQKRGRKMMAQHPSSINFELFSNFFGGVMIGLFIVDEFFFLNCCLLIFVI